MANKKSYRISLALGGQTYVGEGVTLLDALTNLERPSKLMGKAVLRVTNGERTIEQLLLPYRLKMFLRPNAIKYQAKNLSIAFQ